MVSRKVETIRLRFQTLSISRRSCTMTECRNAVAVSQGMKDAFSTGSHAQYPAHPSTSYDHHIPATIARERKIQAVTVQRRVMRIHVASSSPERSAPIAKANGTVIPT